MHNNEKLVAHCASFVKQEEFFSFRNLLKILALGIQDESAAGLNHLGYYIHFQLGGRFPNNTRDLKFYDVFDQKLHTDIDVWFQAAQGKFSYLLIFFDKKITFIVGLAG